MQTKKLRQRPKHELRSVQQLSAPEQEQPPPTQAPPPNPLQRSARPGRRTRHILARWPKAPRRGCVRHQRARVRTPAPRPKHPGYPRSSTPRGPVQEARGQLNTALQVSASAPSARLREVHVSMASAAKDGARSRACEARAAAAAALTGQSADQGAGGCQRPGPEAPP
jgi:hypothetical protein